MQQYHFEWVDRVVALRPTRHKIGHFGHVPQANLLAWYGKTKPNTTKAHIHQSKEMYYNTKYKKTKARFSRLLQHQAWKRRRPILVQRFINLSLTYSLTYSPGTHTGHQYYLSYHLTKQLVSHTSMTNYLHVPITAHCCSWFCTLWKLIYILLKAVCLLMFSTKRHFVTYSNTPHPQRVFFDGCSWLATEDYL